MLSLKKILNENWINWKLTFIEIISTNIVNTHIILFWPNFIKVFYNRLFRNCELSKSSNWSNCELRAKWTRCEWSKCKVPRDGASRCAAGGAPEGACRARRWACRGRRRAAASARPRARCAASPWTAPRAAPCGPAEPPSPRHGRVPLLRRCTSL